MFRYLIDRTASSDFDRYFKIDPNNGQVRTQKALDRETLETHTVKILAVDNGKSVISYLMETIVHKILIQKSKQKPKKTSKIRKP